MTCPSSIALSQAFSSGASRDLQAHLLTCPTCTAEWKSLEKTRAAALELPYVTPDPLRREQLRKRLLAAASQPLPVGPSAQARWLGIAGAAAALLAVLPRVAAYLRLYTPSQAPVEVAESMTLSAREVKRRAGRFVEKVATESSVRDERTGREVSLSGSGNVEELKALTLAVLDGQAEGGSEVRRYFVGRGARVEDPRTGEATPRMKDVLRGEIDLFIAAWLTRPPSDGA